MTHQTESQAVAVVGDRILAVGTLEELKAAAGYQPQFPDSSSPTRSSFPGFIAQHDYPFLTALTMMSEIIAIEDWLPPSGTISAANGREDYLKRFAEAEAKAFRS